MTKPMTLIKLHNKVQFLISVQKLDISIMLLKYISQSYH